MITATNGLATVWCGPETSYISGWPYPVLAGVLLPSTAMMTPLFLMAHLHLPSLVHPVDRHWCLGAEHLADPPTTGPAMQGTTKPRSLESKWRYALKNCTYPTTAFSFVVAKSHLPHGYFTSLGYLTSIGLTSFCVNKILFYFIRKKKKLASGYVHLFMFICFWSTEYVFQFKCFKFCCSKPWHPLTFTQMQFSSLKYVY